jgi:mono/diheme cytochrome c family protein
VVKKGSAQRGQYIVTHVAMCIECHSERDEEGSLIQGRQYMGGAIPTRPSWAREWAERAPRNAGLPGYSDEQALRLLTEGAIARDGRQLRPPMPRFRMTPEDAADVIAFMRSLS